MRARHARRYSLLIMMPSFRAQQLEAVAVTARPSAEAQQRDEIEG